MIHPLTINDLEFCNHLVKQAGWNQTEADWIRILTLDEHHSFIAKNEEASLGTISATLFQEVAWISMVLVDQSHRGQGIGQRLFSYMLAHLQRHNIQSIRLDATAFGQPLYEKYGFRSEYSLVRMFKSKEKISAGSFHPSIRPLDSEKSILTLDQKATGSHRQKLLQRFITEDQLYCFYFDADDFKTRGGYVALRLGRQAMQIGPCIVTDPSKGYPLLNHALQFAGKKDIMIDIPEDHKIAMEWALNHGFIPQRTFIRMILGVPIQEEESSIWASFGPEKG